MLKGYGKLGACLDSRLPITLPILHKIIAAASRFSCSKYQICQFQAMCSIAFYAFLRVGEMTSTNRHGPQPLQLHQVVKLVNNSNSIVSLKLTFQDFKNSYNQPPLSIVITHAPTFCPVQLMLDYLTLRGYLAHFSWHHMVMQFLVPPLLINCLSHWNSASLTQHVTRGTALGLGLLLMLQIGVFLMPK